jgi:nucleoside-diphosphate-sugar epimerase
MKKFLVSGGAGLIGSHITERLLRDGHEVTVLDNLITGQRDNLTFCASHPHFTFLERDITEDCSDLYEGGWDYILHLASPASPVDYAMLPLETMRVGSVGTENMLEIARHSGARILFSSTSEVYGDPDVHPQKEDYNGNVSCTGTRSCYDEAKRYSEALMCTYHRVYKVDIRIARIFNTYGPRNRENDGRVVPNFMLQVLQGQPLTVFGTGKQTRSFCYVGDMVEGLLSLLFSDVTGPVNLGNPAEFTILELAELLQELGGIELPVTFEPLPHEDDPRRRCPDITRAKTLLGWEPKVHPREGMALTMEYYRERLASRSGE